MRLPPPSHSRGSRPRAPWISPYPISSRRVNPNCGMRARTPKTSHDDVPPDERVMRRQRKAAREAGPQWDEDEYTGYGKDDKYPDDDEEDDELAEFMERNERRRD